MSGELTSKIDVLELIINVLSDHEKTLDNQIVEIGILLGGLRNVEFRLDEKLERIEALLKGVEHVAEG